LKGHKARCPFSMSGGQEGHIHPSFFCCNDFYLMIQFCCSRKRERRYYGRRN